MRAHCQGEACLVRFADDFVGSFQFQGGAQNFQRQLQEQFAQFNLELAEEKTRLLIFGRFAAVERRNRQSYYFLSSTSFEGCSWVEIDLAQGCRDEPGIPISNGSVSRRSIPVCGVLLASARCCVSR